MKYFLRIFLLLNAFAADAQNNYLLVGTYTGGKSEGIYVYTFNSSTGKFALKSSIKSPNPSYLAVAPGQRNVYAVYEEGNDKGGGKLAAYSFNKASGKLTYLNEQATGGEHPCYVSVDKTGKWAAVANYSGGNLSILPVQSGGALGAAVQTIQHTGSSVNKQRQEKAHVHCAYFSADNKFLFTPDLGMDKVMVYAFNEKTGQLTEAAVPAVNSPDNGGPRHIILSPSNQYAYLMEELTGSVVAYKYNNGQFTHLQTISAAEKDFKGFMGSADIHISSDGKFLYCSNRGDANTITIFKIDAASGKLSVAGYQSTLGTAPRNFSLDPSGNFLLVANQNSDNIVIFKRNKTTGLLTDTGKKIEIGKPVCLRWAGMQ
jgi:6-phosphogluconolactonase